MIPFHTGSKKGKERCLFLDLNVVIHLLLFFLSIFVIVLFSFEKNRFNVHCVSSLNVFRGLLPYYYFIHGTSQWQIIYIFYSTLSCLYIHTKITSPTYIFLHERKFTHILNIYCYIKWNFVMPLLYAETIFTSFSFRCLVFYPHSRNVQFQIERYLSKWNIVSSLFRKISPPLVFHNFQIIHSLKCFL